MSAPLETELDRQALAALANVKLHHFTAEPSTIGPFASSEISWEVVVPEEYDVTVDINLDGMSVPPTGELSVSPEFTKSYHLRGRAGRYSKVLGTVTWYFANRSSSSCFVGSVLSSTKSLTGTTAISASSVRFSFL